MGAPSLIFISKYGKTSEAQQPIKDTSTHLRYFLSLNEGGRKID